MREGRSRVHALLQVMMSVWVVSAELWSADQLRSEHRAMARRGNRGSRYGGGGDLRVAHSGVGMDR